MKRNTLLPLPLRVISGVTALAQILTGAPVHLCAQDAAPASAASLPQGAPTVARTVAQEIAVNRTIPKTTAATQFPHFSSEPTDNEISAARVFEEPLIPTKGQPDKAENLALSLALNAYLHRESNDNVSAITQFLTAYPTSRWRASILLDMGIVYRWTGYFSKALESWEGAWRLLKNETEPQAKALADRALAELMELNARVGRYETLKPLLAEIRGRQIRGSADEKISRAKEGFWMMENKPGESFLCGPSALSNVFAATHPLNPAVPTALTAARSSVQGFSLAQVEALAKESGLKYRMARRTPGATVPIPCVVNWKVGHYAALVKEDHGRYLVEDPTFAYDIWISPGALDAESSGYFLIPAGGLPTGWAPVSADEGKGIWGKGNSGVADPNHVTADDKKCKPDCPTQGMAQYNFHALVMSLNIWDSPVGYTPPRGPSMNFKVTYNQREASQPAVFTYSNLGQKWTHDWLSYVKDDPTAPAANVLVATGGGGAEAYTFNTTTQTYNVQRDSNTILTRFTSPSLRYERQYPNGAKDIYGLSDGATTFPRKIFLTQRVDPAGNAITFTYDVSYRLVAATDALGQVTALSYELSGQSGDNLLITKVTDPFGRFAKFDYSPSAPRQLIKITDVIGITSQFVYTGDFISAMTTPYGTTTFVMGESGVDRWIEVTDPAGAKERAEFNSDANPNNIPDSEPVAPVGLQLIANYYLKYRNTFYWNKKAVMEAGGDYTKARIWHWFHGSGGTSSVLESEKNPLESRVWYQYPGQTGAQSDSGITVALPSKAARVLDDGKTQLSQYTYTATGLPTTVIQPALDGSGNPIAGRTLSYDYDPVNNVDLTKVRQTTGGSNETLSQFTYNSQHRPLTATDAAGQVATFTYNSSGQVLTETRVRNGASETTTWGYDANGYLMSVTGPLPGASVSFTYDGYGRVRTVTDSVGYALVYDYDNLDRVTKVTFPDRTFQQTIYDRLDPQQQRDRLGRWTYTMYDALRHPVWMYDAAGRTTSYDWCTCGALNSITDGEGHKTSFTRDLQYRLTGKTYADNSSLSYIYESATSRLKSMTDAKAQVTNYQYYVDDNLMQISYTGGNPLTPSVSFTYDPNYNRVASMTDGTGTTSYGYNPITSTPTLGAGRLASVDQPLTNDTVTYGYDEYGRVTNRSINGAANATSTVYDSLGRVTSTSNLLGSFNYAYVSTTPRVDHTNYPNGQITQYIYFGNTGDQRLQEIWNKTSSGSTISKFDYTYSAVGDIASWSQKAGASTPFVHSFGYDGADQLLGDSVTLSGATQHQYSYRYDRAGNRTSEQIDSSENPASYNNLNQLTSRGGNGQMTFEGTLNEPGTVAIAGGSPVPTDGSNHFRLAAPVIIGSNSLPIVATDASGNATSNHIQLTVSGTAVQTLTYDLNGNLVGDGTRTFEWDAVNRLTAVSSGTNRSEFTYNGLSQRVKIIEKTNGSVTSTKQLVWCPGDTQPCEERDASNNVTKRFYAQGVRIGSTNYYYTRDHLGSIRELTNGSGTVQARYDYDPYGRRTRLTGTLDADFGFTGHYYHQPSGLHLALYRAYNADLGRWISRDPLKSAEMREGVNLYAYVGNNPMMWSDPSGEGRIWDWIFSVIDSVNHGFAGAAAAAPGVGAIAIEKTAEKAYLDCIADPNNDCSKQEENLKRAKKACGHVAGEP
jgi:RHS repeat-associated protein